jgi:hypothetical protein
MFLSVLESRSAAGIVALNPSRDTSIFEESNNAGGNGALFVGHTAGNLNTTVRRALTYFDVSGSIPAGSTINAVSLRLSLYISPPAGNGADQLLLHRLTADWGETTVGVGVRAGGLGTTPGVADATWIYNFYTSSSWATPGGDFVSTPSGAITLNGIDNEFTFSGQQGLVADVQDWVNNPSTNFGWLMKYDNEVDFATARGFWSGDDNVQSIFRPLLTIDFTAVPEPHTCVLLGAVAIVAYASRFRRKRT